MTPQHHRPDRSPALEIVDGLEPVEWVGEERPDENVLVYSIHDGAGVPAELLGDGERQLMERPEVRRAYRRERDWGANLVAGHLARELGLGGFLRVNLARLVLDFGRFPGCSPAGAPHLERKAIFPPMSGLLSPETRETLLRCYYDRISRALTPRFVGKKLLIAVHTYDALQYSRAYRPEVSLITGSESQARAGMTAERIYDPLFPTELGEAVCDPMLTCRTTFEVEHGGRLVAMNYPYAMSEGCLEYRAQVRFFYDYLRRRFNAAFPETENRIAYRRLWEMLFDVSRRAGWSRALHGYLHRREPSPPGLGPLFAEVHCAYRRVSRFAADNRGELVADYRFAGERPSCLGIEVRKDLLSDLDREGEVADLKPGAGATAHEIAGELASPIASYLETMFPGRQAPGTVLPFRPAAAA